MKKMLLIGVLFASSLLALRAEDCISTNDNFSAVYCLPEPIKETHSSVNFEVLPQIELISIIQTISKYQTKYGFLMIQDTFLYQKEILKNFSSFRNHPVIQMFDSLSLKPGKMNFSAPSSLMLYLDNNLNLRNDIIFDDFIIKRCGGIDSIKLFLNFLKDFSQKSSFNKFFKEHTDFYKRIISLSIKSLGDNNIIQEIEEFYGLKQENYNVCLVSMYNFVGFGNSILHKNKKMELYNVIGPRSIEKDIPDFGDAYYLKYMLRHEFSHPFVNTLTEENWNYIKDYSAKFETIPDVAKKRICGDWQECINEFVIRAVSVHLAYKENEELGQQVYDSEKSRGVYNLDDLLEHIREYENNRNRYATFGSYYKNILDIFKKE
ncbi:MAG: DUF4932 domain-containing protein [Bacteroidales bacterium]|nr:DUF4932 domain-containing protein [Bacteroidales bacterium]